ncbi:redox-sensing transcriptional repressor Rex [Roseibacillus persicicus]|uniref:Redox-sensing transcriptional repressor Rex n=1 Tax=Roseibacillus persicicus TaxID=454148 RepID=A0A918TCY9_9BACT|nr:redox-sensing transcriptional repressor Rex [Roseibacillus persicicus]GHC41514.1 redox-sensing transcriptional repressor Rex [Roseibacillus persicicus]
MFLDKTGNRRLVKFVEIDREKAGIPKKTIYRLSLYHRCLFKLTENGLETVSSSALAKAAGVKASQLRRDLSHVGQFGTRGLGYQVEELRMAIREVLGREHLQPVILVGAGNLGCALLRYGGFQKEGFEVIAAFDAVPEAVMKRDIGVPLFNSEKLDSFIVKNKVKLAILCVPAEKAQEVANDLVLSGVQGILNFSPTVLQVPEKVTVNNVDLALELENLSFFIDRDGEEEE